MSSEQKYESVEAKGLSKKDYIYAVKGLAWLIGTVLDSTLNYWQSRVKFLRVRNVDIVSNVRVEPTEKGYRAIIEVEPTDETIGYFAQKYWELDKIVKMRRRVLKQVARIKKLSTSDSAITNKLYMDWVREHAQS